MPVTYYRGCRFVAGGFYTEYNHGRPFLSIPFADDWLSIKKPEPPPPTPAIPVQAIISAVDQLSLLFLLLIRPRTGPTNTGRSGVADRLLFLPLGDPLKQPGQWCGEFLPHVS
jgi:hypothetical protein